MFYYLIQHISDVAPFHVNDGETTDLECATVVLQHSSGPVGFERSGGVEALRALVHEGVAIELANGPRWATYSRDLVSSESLHSEFRRVLTCAGPSESLLEELGTISTNLYRIKVNALATRHGRPPVSLAPTVFDGWILPSGRVDWKPLAHLVDSCSSVALWSFSEWGLHAKLLGHGVGGAVAPVFEAGQALSIPLRRVLSEGELPTW